MRRRIRTRVVSLVRSEPWTEQICTTISVCVRNHLEIVEQSSNDWKLISGAPVMISSLIVGNPRSEEVRGYALTTTTKTERLEG
ncbi:hypothetical protein DY000_02011520 [Brassica cretica]|uniref:Uncharacterized protein n=1 Tax=Brassica cretica TaxID=69181 RepID=A0ABQ7D423_BRACR|nr:hypothetical protein DY000_02011520 [Brassica cretica]